MMNSDENTPNKPAQFRRNQQVKKPVASSVNTHSQTASDESNPYVNFIIHLFDFLGTAGRLEFLAISLLMPLAAMILMSPALYIASMGALKLAKAWLGIVFIITTIPCIAVSVRRLHDMNKSAFFLIIAFIPAVGPLILFVMLLFMPSDFSSDNPYRKRLF